MKIKIKQATKTGYIECHEGGRSMHRTQTARPGEGECKRMEMSAQPSRHKFKKSMYLRYGNGEAVLYDKYNSRFVGRGGVLWNYHSVSLSRVSKQRNIPCI